MDMRFLETVPYIAERWTALVEKNENAEFLTEETSGKRFTRREVDQLSARVYGWLCEKGMTAEDFVMIRFPRTALPFIAMLGVWKAGAAFTVVEDGYAPERVKAIWEDCGCKLEINEAVWPDILATEPKPGFRKANPHDACFAIYTSGSTGTPKGVLQEYGKLQLNQASAEPCPGYLFDKNDCMAMLASLSFIAAVKQFACCVYSGMRLVVFSAETARDPYRMNQMFLQYSITIAFLSPSILRAFSMGIPLSLHTLVTGSESANGIFFDGVRLVNNYGMSEAGFHVAEFEVDRRYDITPIGKPVYDEIEIRLLNGNGDPVPDGEEGEICFEDPFFRGYIHRPEETERVLRDGVFHSGDMGKRLPDGNIIVTGRIKTMIKINGNRVEPGEIEACMRKIPGIHDAVVKDFRTERQQVYICAYYTGENTLTEAFLRNRLERELPHYMIPAFFQRLEALPLNQNGKVDRFALLPPDLTAKTKPYVAPRTLPEQAICSAMEKTLGLGRVGIQDDFFELGGDSVSAAMLSAELTELNVDYKDIYTFRTPQAIAACLESKKEIDLDVLARKAEQADQPLTPYQTYFYDAMLYAPGNTHTNNPFAIKFPRGRIDPERLKAALETVFAAYACFHSVLAFSDEFGPVLRRVPGRIVHPEIREMADWNKEKMDNFIQPYSLHNELLYRCEIDVTPTQTILLLDTCHIISDGTTMENFIKALFAAYDGEALKPDHYFYYLQRQHDRRKELERDADAVLLMRRYAREDYVCNPPPDRVSRRVANSQYHFRTSLTVRELSQGCIRLGASMNKLFVAAALVALSKCSARSKVSVEWTYNGRDENWKRELVGMTLSAVPVAVDLEQSSAPGALIRQIDEQNELGMRYADLSLGNRGITPGDRDRMFVIYETGFSMAALLPEGTEIESAYDRLNGTFTRLQMLLFDTGRQDEALPYYVNYNSELYSAALIETFCGYFDDALRWLIGG